MVQQSLQNVLKEKEIDREVVTLITQTIVDKDDPSINDPQKFIGRRYEKDEAEHLAKQFNWKIKEQEPGSWRQVVPSPLPQFIEHGRSIQTLVDNGTIVIASGGGGIPTFWNNEQKLEGLNAVIDKDLSAALLGRVIKSNELWIITDLDQACLNFGKDNEEPLLNMNTEEAKHYLDEGHFQAGSMGPKIEAALYFLKYHGEKVIITSIEGVKKAIVGKNGTTIVNQ
jgi:carbamate kinase